MSGQKKKDQPKKKIYLGRDSAMGQVAFRTGTHLSLKNKLENRNSKQARRETRELCRHSEG